MMTTMNNNSLSRRRRH